MSEMIERVARALADNASGWSSDWPGFVPAARAAIEAIQSGRTQEMRAAELLVEGGYCATSSDAIHAIQYVCDFGNLRIVAALKPEVQP